MRARTWLLVGAVALIGLVAVADSVRGRLERDSSPEAAAADDDRPPAAGLTGVLYYTDQFCALQAVRLPEIEPARPPAWTGCGVVVSPDGLSAAAEGSRWSPRGRLRVASSGRLIQIFSRREPVSGPFLASVPAFKPDGTLTFFRDGRVVAWQGDTVVFNQRRLRATIRRALGAPRPRNVVVHDLAWLTDTRAVAILGWGPEKVLAVFEGRDIVAAFPALGGGFRRLRASPRGSYFALESDEMLLFDRDARSLAAVGFPNFHALAWSPDERWLAIAAGRRVLVFRADDPTRPRRRLELEARDLAWR